MDFRIGTSGYSFADWVGNFYPPGTRSGDMFNIYADSFNTVELNFTFYRMPSAGMLARFAERSPVGFDFWVKANRSLTHDLDASVAGEFVESLAPLAEKGKLAGTLLQFPQSFHRTVANRKYLASLVEPFGEGRLAVEFRHRSWEGDSTLSGLAERGLTVVIPDVPEIEGLYRSAPAVTTNTGYLRLHSRLAGKWYAGMAKRYDYSYSNDKLRALADDWASQPAERVYVFFNNCHRGQAADNARAFQRIVEGL